MALFSPPEHPPAGAPAPRVLCVDDNHDVVDSEADLLGAGVVSQVQRSQYRYYSLAGAVKVAGGLEFAHPSGLRVVIPVG